MILRNNKKEILKKFKKKYCQFLFETRFILQQSSPYENSR